MLLHKLNYNGIQLPAEGDFYHKIKYEAMNHQLTLEFSDEAQSPLLRVADVSSSALLPQMGQMVVANVKFTRNWPECLGGLKITYKQILVKRIKSTSNSKGWQWSGANSDSFINGDVVSWHYR